MSSGHFSSSFGVPPAGSSLPGTTGPTPAEASRFTGETARAQEAAPPVVLPGGSGIQSQGAEQFAVVNQELKRQASRPTLAPSAITNQPQVQAPPALILPDNTLEGQEALLHRKTQEVLQEIRYAALAEVDEEADAMDVDEDKDASPDAPPKPLINFTEMAQDFKSRSFNCILDFFAKDKTHLAGSLRTFNLVKKIDAKGDEVEVKEPIQKSWRFKIALNPGHTGKPNITFSFLAMRNPNNIFMPNQENFAMEVIFPLGELQEPQGTFKVVDELVSENLGDCVNANTDVAKSVIDSIPKSLRNEMETHVVNHAKVQFLYFKAAWCEVVSKGFETVEEFEKRYPKNSPAWIVATALHNLQQFVLTSRDHQTYVTAWFSITGNLEGFQQRVNRPLVYAVKQNFRQLYPWRTTSGAPIFKTTLPELKEMCGGTLRLSKKDAKEVKYLEFGAQGQFLDLGELLETLVAGAVRDDVESSTSEQILALGQHHCWIVSPSGGQLDADDDAPTKEYCLVYVKLTGPARDNVPPVGTMIEFYFQNTQGLVEKINNHWTGPVIAVDPKALGGANFAVWARRYKYSCDQFMFNTLEAAQEQHPKGQLTVKLAAQPNSETLRRTVHGLHELWNHREHESVSRMIHILLGRHMTQEVFMRNMARGDAQFELANQTDYRLNWEQKEAVTQALGEGYLTNIQGPPGCGKTVTLGAIACEAIKRDVAVLLTASSNNAVDEIARKIAQYLPENSARDSACYPLRIHVKQAELANITNAARKKLDNNPQGDDDEMETEMKRTELLSAMEFYRLPMADRVKRAEAIAKDYHFAMKTVSLSESMAGLIISEENALAKHEADGTLNDLGEQQRETLLLTRRFRVLCHQYESRSIARKDRKAYNRGYDELAERAISKKKIILTTTGNTLSGVLDNYPCGLIAVDDSGQLSEAECLAMFSHFTGSLKKFVMIGDIKQLQPTVVGRLNEFAPQRRISLMERLLSNGLSSVTLSEQFRMAPQISRLINEHFYNGVLRDSTSVQQPNHIRSQVERWIDIVTGIKNRHCVFIDLPNSQSWKAPAGYSRENIASANWTAHHLVQMICDLRADYRIPADNITVMAMYAAQVDLIKKILRDLLNKNEARVQYLGFTVTQVLSSVQIETVDGYQGKENELVYMDIVGTATVDEDGQRRLSKFLRTSNRICVALSRAKQGLIIVGKAAAFGVTAGSSLADLDASQQRQAGPISRIIHDLQSRGAFFSDPSFLDTSEQRAQYNATNAAETAAAHERTHQRAQENVTNMVARQQAEEPRKRRRQEEEASRPRNFRQRFMDGSQQNRGNGNRGGRYRGGRGGGQQGSNTRGSSQGGHGGGGRGGHGGRGGSGEGGGRGSGQAAAT